MGKDHSKNIQHTQDEKAKKEQEKKATKAKVGRKGK